MGQCMSAAAPIVKEHIEEAIEDALATQQQAGNENSSPQPTRPQGGRHDQSAALYASLPSDAEKHEVRNVYDGDTFTLTNERRVRLLGIDTPEIKERQPFAQEAKAYTKDRCDKREVYLSFEPGSEREDHYGRLLCYVWVSADDGKYLCINEGIIEAGLARAYTPGKGKEPHNWKKLIDLQSNARKQRLGLWSDFDDHTVYKTANGAAYHKRSCQHLASVRNLKELRVSEALDMGLHPCRTCME